MKSHFSIFLLLLMCMAFSLHAQHPKAERLFKKAQKAENKNKFKRAISLYSKAIDTDPKWCPPYQAYAGLALRMQNTSSAFQTLSKAWESCNNPDPRIAFMLGEQSFEKEAFNEALHWMTLFLEQDSDYEQLTVKAHSYTDRCQRIIDAQNRSLEVRLTPLPGSINTPAQEYLPLLSATEDFMIFTRRQNRDEDFYGSVYAEGKWQAAVPIHSLNTRYPDGAASLSADATTMILTRCHDRNGYGSCDLYISRWTGQDWSKPINLGPKINTEYKETQPCLSADGSRLYFSSNRPGGHGKMDIWAIDWLPEGRWGRAFPLDSTINSSSNEKTPFIHYDHQSLYFTSDRPKSFGKTDLFVSRKKGAHWTTPQNLGWPINTTSEEGTIYVSKDGSTAYMGRRLSDTSDFDIVSFSLPEHIAAVPSTYFYGRVIDAQSHQGVAARIVVIDDNRDTLARLSASANGKFMITLSKDRSYQFYIKEPGYVYYSGRWEGVDLIQNSMDGNVFEFPVQPLAAPDSSTTFRLNNIFFASGSAKLLPSSQSEIKELYQLLVSQPTIGFEIHGHTDQVGSAQANQILSMQRAKAVHDELIQMGIDAKRLRYKGFGESQPLTTDDSEEGRAQNRRTEFVIWKVE